MYGRNRAWSDTLQPEAEFQRCNSCKKESSTEVTRTEQMGYAEPRPRRTGLGSARIMTSSCRQAIVTGTPPPPPRSSLCKICTKSDMDGEGCCWFYGDWATGIRFPAGSRIFLFATVSRPTLGSILWVPAALFGGFAVGAWNWPLTSI